MAVPDILACSAWWTCDAASEKVGGGTALYALGITGVLLTHPLSFLTLIFAMVLIILFFIRQFFNPKFLIHFVLSSLVAMVLTTAYWLPAFEQLGHQKFRVFYGNIFEAKDFVPKVSELVTSLGLPLTIAFIVSIVLYLVNCIYFKKTNWTINKLIIISLVYFWLIVSKEFWGSAAGDLLSFFQFPERFVHSLGAIYIITMTLICREIMDNCSAHKITIKWQRAETCIIAVTIVMFAVILGKSIIYYNGVNRVPLDEELEHTMLYVHRGVSAGEEWLPSDSLAMNCTEPNTAHAPDGSGADGIKHDNGKSFDVYLLADNEYYDIPYIYYYGYRAYVLDENSNISQELQTGKAENSNGYLKVYLPDDYEDDIIHVLVTYRKTTIQIISYIISLITAVAILAGSIVWRIKQTK